MHIIPFPTVDVYVPAEQLLHTIGLVAPKRVLYVPYLHPVQFKILNIPKPVLKVPAMH